MYLGKSRIYLWRGKGGVCGRGGRQGREGKGFRKYCREGEWCTGGGVGGGQYGVKYDVEYKEGWGRGGRGVVYRQYSD